MDNSSLFFLITYNELNKDCATIRVNLIYLLHDITISLPLLLRLGIRYSQVDCHVLSSWEVITQWNCWVQVSLDNGHMIMMYLRYKYLALFSNIYVYI